MENNKCYVAYAMNEKVLVTSSSIFERKDKFEAEVNGMTRVFKGKADIVKVEYQNYFQARTDKSFRQLREYIREGIKTGQITEEDVKKAIEKLQQDIATIANIQKGE